MSVRSYIVDDREKKTLPARSRSPGVGGRPAHGDGANLRPLLDLCRPFLRAEEARRFPLAQGRRPAGDLLPRPGRATFHCLFNTCRHRGAIVCTEREGNRRRFQCIYHGWTYGNDGRLVGVPGDDAYAESFDKSALRPAAAGAVRGVSRLLVHVSRRGRRSARRLSGRRQGLYRSRHRPVAVRARWRSSPACRNTTSPPTGS